MTSNTFYTLAVFAIVLLIITKPIGLWLTPIAQGRAPAVVDAIDRRLISVLAPSGREESWQRYAVSLLTFNTLGLIFLYVLQRIQGVSGFLCLGRLFQGQPNEAALCI